jgi:hypothetical protein
MEEIIFITNMITVKSSLFAKKKFKLIEQTWLINRKYFSLDHRVMNN